MLVGHNINRESHGRNDTLFLWEGENGKGIILLERFYVLLSRPSDRSGSLMKKKRMVSRRGLLQGTCFLNCYLIMKYKILNDVIFRAIDLILMV
jgi:hypothetical protein